MAPFKQNASRRLACARSALAVFVTISCVSAATLPARFAQRGGEAPGDRARLAASAVTQSVTAAGDALAADAARSARLRADPHGGAAALALGTASFRLRRGSRRPPEEGPQDGLALEGPAQAAWDWNIVDGTAIYSPNHARVPGHDGAGFREPLVEHSARVHPDDADGTRAALERCLSGEASSYVSEYRVLRGDGDYVWVESRGAVVERTADGRPARMVGTIVDVGPRRESLQALAESARLLEQRSLQVEMLGVELARRAHEAEAATRARNAFLRNVGHEFRTPMNQILGGLELVLCRSPDPESERWLRLVRESARALLGVVNKALDVAALEAGALELDDDEFSIAAIVEEACRAARGGTPGAKPALVVEVDDDVPARVRGDRARVSQALLDYVENAIKFTERGEVAVSVRLDAPAGVVAHPLVRFEVRDTGIGIDAVTGQRLFAAFSQGDASLSRRHGGMGTGLYRTRAIARLMGGDAGFDSTPGEGSTFWFTARLHPASCAASPEPPAGRASHPAHAATAASRQAAATPASTAVDPARLREVLDELESMISGDDLCAVGKLRESAPVLAAVAGESEVEKLRAAVEHFDFASALATVGRIRELAATAA